MIKRRNFLLWGTLLGISPYLKAKEHETFTHQFKPVEKTITAVLSHFFPEKSKLPSAHSMQVSAFLFDTIAHKSYDKDIRDFVIEGAKELEKREDGHFTTLSTQEKEKALRSYEETNYGSSWLSRVLTLGMEGLFSDPIYGSNLNEAGWKSIGAFGGFPRPKTKYLES